MQILVTYISENEGWILCCFVDTKPFTCTYTSNLEILIAYVIKWRDVTVNHVIEVCVKQK